MILIGDAADEQGWKAEGVTTKSAPPRRGVATLRRSIGLGPWLVFSSMAFGKCAKHFGWSDSSTADLSLHGSCRSPATRLCSTCSRYR